MNLRNLERDIIRAAVEWHVSGEKLGKKGELRFEKSLSRLSEMVAAYLKEIVVAALNNTESRYGDGRVFKRNNKFWIAYYVDGKEIRQPVGYTEEKARTALVERKVIEAYSASLPQFREESKIQFNKRHNKFLRAAEKTTADDSGSAEVPNKNCKGCGKPFHAYGRALRCNVCMKKVTATLEELATTKNPPPSSSPQRNFADNRCLDCENPFKSFNGAKRCEGCIKKRLKKKSPTVAAIVTAGEDEDSTEELSVRSRLVP